MEHNFNIFYRLGIKQQTVDGLSRLLTTGTDDSDIDDGISVMAVATRAEKKLSKFTDVMSEKTQKETSEP